MNRKALFTVLCLLAVMATGTSSVWAARRKAAPETPLTGAGQRLQKRYAAMLTKLQADISKAVPAVTEQKKSAYLKARLAEKTAEAEVKAAQQRLGKIATAKALVGHAKGKWIGGADKGIAEAQANLKKATTEAERNAAQNKLVKWRKNREDGIKALKERQGALDKVKREEPRLVRALEAAKKALTRTQAGMMKTVKNPISNLSCRATSWMPNWRNTLSCSRPRRVVWRSLPSRARSRPSWSRSCWAIAI